MQKDLGGLFSYDNFHLRPLIEDDIPILVPLINDAYSYQDEVKGQPRTSIAHLEKRASEVDLYVLEDDLQIVGCVYLEPQGSTLHFGLLTVVPEMRGKGIASAIMKAIDSYASQHQFQMVALDYMSLAPWLKRYYEKYGFIETGAINQWGKIDLIRMQKKVIYQLDRL